MNSKIIGIHQPNYIPWLGYFYKIFESDVFVFHDDVQFSKSGSHNYHYIKTANGPFRLKIPVEQKHGYKINEVRTKDELGWKKEHLKRIRINYLKAPFFNEIYGDFESILLSDYDNLSELNIGLIKFIANKLGIETEYVVASSLHLNTRSEEKVIDICTKLSADIYLSGTGAKAYQKEENFLDRGIKLEYSKSKPFEFKQLWGDPFQSNVSILDFLMNYGYDWDFVIEKLKNNE